MPSSAPSHEPALDEDAIARAAALLAKAECPVIFVGGGAIDASAEVRALAERLSAPVVGYRRGKGVLDERHLLSHVLPGGHALWAGADVVLAVGTRLQIPVNAWGIDDKLAIIKIDVDASEMERVCKPAIGILGRAQAVLKRLANHLAHLDPMRPERIARSRALKEKIAAELSELTTQVGYLR